METGADWRRCRGRILNVGGDGGESNSPSRELPAGMCYRLVRRLVLALRVPCRPEFPGSQPVVLCPRYRRCAGCTSTYGAHSLPSRRGEGGRGSRVRPPGLLAFRQLLFCRLVDGADGAPACNSARPPPVETTRPHVMIQHSHYSTGCAASYDGHCGASRNLGTGQLGVVGRCLPAVPPLRRQRSFPPPLDSCLRRNGSKAAFVLPDHPCVGRGLSLSLGLRPLPQ